MNKCLGYAAVAAMLTIGSGRAPAQITTVVSSPKRTDSSQRQAVLREKAAQDSTARVTLTGMTQWVDSAAASLSLRPDTASAPPPETATPPRTPAASTDSTARSDARRADKFRNGARAPNTATQLPSLALAGAAMIMIGVAIRRRRSLARSRTTRT